MHTQKIVRYYRNKEDFQLKYCIVDSGIAIATCIGDGHITQYFNFIFTCGLFYLCNKLE